MQQCTVCILYFTANLLYMFRVPFTPIIGTGNSSCRPLVQVLCCDRLDGLASNPLESIRSQVTNTLHRGQVNTFTAKVDHSRFNNSCLRLPASTLVELIFQSHSFSLGGKLVQQLQYI
jgi:hypothetical protein